MLSNGLQDLDGGHRPICVVGAGPAGLALSTELAKLGAPVLLLESGGTTSNATIQALSQGELVHPARHDDLMVATARRMGGTSNLWGGRSIPYDRIDFIPRSWVDARWPISYDDLMQWIPHAAKATRGGRAVYHAERALLPNGSADFEADRIERWVNIQQAQIIHSQAIAEEALLDARTHVTLVDMEFAEDGRVTAIHLAHSLTGERARLTIDILVISAGGLETTRLLLAARRTAPDRFGGADGPLGRYYMGHVIGEIADIVFANERMAHEFNFVVDSHGSYTRRRIVAADQTQIDHQLLNCSFWPVVPPVADARHGNAILSLVYLALAFGPLGRRLTAEAIRRRHVPEHAVPILPHLVNLVTGVPSSIVFAIEFLYRRYNKHTRLPGFFVHNKARRYGWSYHAEQAPTMTNRVQLSSSVDRLGLPQLRINFQFCDQDINSVVRTHDLLEDWLVRNGIGRLDYRMPRDARAEGVLAQASHGTHQIGLARMGSHRREGVVDADLRCFDTPNLYIASSAVLPTSSQANPTVSTVALSIRLAHHLAARFAKPVAVDTVRSPATNRDTAIHDTRK